MPNEAMVQSWDGPDGQSWADNADRFDASSIEFTDLMLEGAAVRPGDRVVDVGCGCGVTTIRAAKVAGRVTGVDLSAPMLGVARERAAKAGAHNITFEKSDAQTKRFEQGSADLVMSRFGVMFFDDPVAAFANLRTALAADGRLAFVCWRDMPSNEWMSLLARTLAPYAPGGPPPGPPSDGPGPFAFADRDKVRSILDRAGFGSIDLQAADRPMHMGADQDEAISFLGGSGMGRRFLGDAPPDKVEAAMASLREAIAPHAGPDGVKLNGAAWLVTARA